MIQGMETNVFATLGDVFTAETRLSRLLAPLEPRKKLARMLVSPGLASLETHSCSIGKPQRGLSAHCSREIFGAQVIHEQGDSPYATSPLSC